MREAEGLISPELVAERSHLRSEARVRPAG